MSRLDWHQIDRYHLEYGCGQRRPGGMTCRGVICRQRACGRYTLTRAFYRNQVASYASWVRNGTPGDCLHASADKAECIAAVTRHATENGLPL